MQNLIKNVHSTVFRILCTYIHFCRDSAGRRIVPFPQWEWLVGVFEGSFGTQRNTDDGVKHKCIRWGASTNGAL